jgi:hypothetical protein
MSRVVFEPHCKIQNSYQPTMSTTFSFDGISYPHSFSRAMDDKCVLAYTAMSTSCAPTLGEVRVVKLRAVVSSNQAFCNSDPIASDDFSTRLTRRDGIHRKVMAPEHAMRLEERSQVPRQRLLTRKMMANMSPPELLDWLSGD